MGLAEFFGAYFKPVYLMDPRHPKSPRTVAEYERAIEDWVDATGDPPLGEIDEHDLDALVEYLMGQPGKRRNSRQSAETIRKKCRELQTVLFFTARPRSKASRRAAGIFDSWTLWFDPPDADPIHEHDDKTLTLEELDAWLEVCDQARAPAPVLMPAADWWRALIRFLYYTGFRIGTALAIRWQWIRGETISIPAKAMKGRKSARFWLTAGAIEALEPIRSSGRELVFPWPHYAGGWLTIDATTSTARKAIDRERIRLQTLAGIRLIGFHGQRRLFGNLVWAEDAVAAQSGLGHAAAGTTAGAYVGSKAKSAVIERALPALKHPEPVKSDTQLRLFD